MKKRKINKRALKRTARSTFITKSIENNRKQVEADYTNIAFPGAFSGLNRFQQYYNKKHNVKVPRDVIHSILSNLPVYQMHLQSKHVFKRRHFHSEGAGINFQADLGYMPDYKSFKYFLLMVDLYSNYIYVEPLKEKTKIAVRDAFDSIFESNDLFKFSTLETDFGQEFVSNQNYFKDKNIYLNYKTGANKSSQAELFIKIFKSSLYKYLRFNLTQNWPEAVPKVVDLLNKRKETGSLKGQSPEQVNSPFADPYSRPILEKNIAAAKGEPMPLKGKSFKKGQFVFLNFLKQTLYKGFDTQRGTIYQILSVDKHTSPYMYKLKELDGTKKAGKYYYEELKSAPNPAKMPHEIEYILDTKIEHGETQYFVKWMYYPDK